MEQYKTDAEIYAVLEREIIDLTIRPGSPLSENPLCARFGAPRTLIRMVLQRLKESGLVRIVPYKGTTVTRLNRRIVDELIYERTAVEAKVLRDFTPKMHSGATGADPGAGGCLRSPCTGRGPGLQQAVRGRPPAARDLVCGYG